MKPVSFLLHLAGSMSLLPSLPSLDAIATITPQHTLSNPTPAVWAFPVPNSCHKAFLHSKEKLKELEVGRQEHQPWPKQQPQLLTALLSWASHLLEIAVDKWSLSLDDTSRDKTDCRDRRHNHEQRVNKQIQNVPSCGYWANQIECYCLQQISR